LETIMAVLHSRSSLTLTGGTNLSFVTAGDARRPAVLLVHGFPSSADTFRDIVPPIAEIAYVIAPDLPGFGRSDVLETTTFDGLAAALSELLDHLRVRERFIYLHDFGAPVGFLIAMNDPALVRGLIVQNANAHRTGFGPQWKDTFAFWSHPDADNEAAATAHLTLAGVRDQYIAGVPDDIARRISPSIWEEDWRVMSQPGRLAAQRALIADYAEYVARFEAISSYLRTHQPPALMVWGRHDVFFEIAEVVSWMEDLPRMEAHILDGGHFLLETHAGRAGELIREFIERTQKGAGP
jgi:pimeloyl-ACP methyl ester carboxylesterase